MGGALRMQHPMQDKAAFILFFNKNTVALEWMQNFEAFQAALVSHANSRDADDEPTYMSSLMNNMSLFLDEFYKHLKAVGVSSLTGDGLKEFFDAVEESRKQYEKKYIPELERVKAEKEMHFAAVKQDSMRRMVADFGVDHKRNPAAFTVGDWEEDGDCM